MRAPCTVQNGVGRTSRLENAFTLLELLVVIAVIGILAALLLPALNGANACAKRATCLNNLRQINLAVRQYADDHNALLPMITNSGPPEVWSDYALFVRSYLGLKGSPSSNDVLFACPADTFDVVHSEGYKPEAIHLQAKFRFNSYAFNAANSSTMYSQLTGTITAPGIAGRTMSSVKEPVKTVLVAELPALAPFSWHQPVKTIANNARDVVSFVDGHASYIKMYWDATNISFGHVEAWDYDPPPGYDYKWSGD